MSLEPTVIVADDDDEAREVLADFLGEHGYSTLVARDGRDVLVLLDALGGAPAILLLDLMMPRMSGFEVLDVLANLGRLEDVPVLILSAIPRPATLPFGVDGYLMKPLDPAKLLGALASVAPAPPRRRPPRRARASSRA